MNTEQTLTDAERAALLDGTSSLAGTRRILARLKAHLPGGDALRILRGGGYVGCQGYPTVACGRADTIAPHVAGAQLVRLQYGDESSFAVWASVAPVAMARQVVRDYLLAYAEPELRSSVLAEAEFDELLARLDRLELLHAERCRLADVFRDSYSEARRDASWSELQLLQEQVEAELEAERALEDRS